ncbi:LegC family aminotransferase [Fluviicola taffensis]|uniref:GDP-perosamine synthase n=1 Tax=Fluviicola taffensis (strain DSM 16823 / NCIMB 13979 / RW262) TaxID=755732 RepID=F2IA13_FLUTR|nr:LegC family aminotransferase [Fluviicola taffensis]AEA44171.1 DegT/DnrJ/EryC1/StrS aminotransferase [Fluviicola taffensis DSM 16823]
MDFASIVNTVRNRFGKEGFIPLHAPYFGGNEKEYLIECIDSTFVSSVGPFVDRFEKDMCEITGSKFAIAAVNGTAALHMALIIAGVEQNDEVISQALTFVATANAISYIGALPVFLDVDKDTLGLSPNAVLHFLKNETHQNEKNECINSKTGNRIKACVPMHTFGFPMRINELLEICNQYNIVLVEDAAESLGSYVGEKHTGTIGHIAAFSFNGNKTVTSGGGGAIITNNEEWAKRAKYLTTTAKVPHAWDFFHDEIGYNYRMPNINAALACAQLEILPKILENKRETANSYLQELPKVGIHVVAEREGTKANYWLNTIVLDSKDERDAFLKFSNEQGVMTRPIWTLMNRLPAFKDCQTDSLENSIWLEDRVVNLPSSVVK